MKKKIKFIHVIFIILFLLFVFSEIQDKKHEKIQNCIIETLDTSSGYDDAKSYCEREID